MKFRQQLLHPSTYGHWMTFFDLAEGGGEEIGRARSDGAGAGGCFSAVVTRGRDVGAL